MHVVWAKTCRPSREVACYPPTRGGYQCTKWVVGKEAVCAGSLCLGERYTEGVCDVSDA